MYLILNVGSTSIKYAIFDLNLSEQKRGQVEEFAQLIKELGSNFKPSAIGHRIVHGGNTFTEPIKVDKATLLELEKISSLAPLHNPPALKALKMCMDTWAQVPQIACFDTAYYSKMPLFSRIYALPYELYQDHGIQRFGFHGLSHQFVANEAAKQLGKSLSDLKLITCHLGGGCSITAIEDGFPIDTSMGFTPMEGLVMATRCGNVDPGIIFYLQREQGLTFEQVEELLNQKSGVYGLSGISHDPRELHAIAGRQNDPDDREAVLQSMRCSLALQVYAYQVRKYIGAYFVALGGLDALVFTGAAGVGAGFMRDMITNGLNETLGDFKTLVIKTNEELTIAREIGTLI